MPPAFDAEVYRKSTVDRRVGSSELKNQSDRATFAEATMTGPAQTVSQHSGSTSPAARKWGRRFAILAVCIAIVASGAYATRRTLLLNVARIALNRDAGLTKQEREDTVAVVFSPFSSAWVASLKNEMNEIWETAKVRGVNYYTFAGPRSVLHSFSERSDPLSPYYQAWVGAYVIRGADGSTPADPEALARELTTLDQRSWLDAMGDPHPLAELDVLKNIGTISIDGRSWPLWHITYRSHSDLSSDPRSQLARLVGMPSKSSWPSGLAAFHDVTLDGNLAWEIDAQRKVMVLVYEVSASYPGQPTLSDNTRHRLDAELLRMMSSAKLQSVPY